MVRQTNGSVAVVFQCALLNVRRVPGMRPFRLLRVLRARMDGIRRLTEPVKV